MNDQTASNIEAVIKHFADQDKIVTQKDLLTALHFYTTHKAKVIQWQKMNPDLMKIRAKRYQQNIKLNDPVKHQQNLASKKLYYYEVIKPKIAAAKLLQSQSK